MASFDLTARDIDIAFRFRRNSVLPVRRADGVVAKQMQNVPRLDHAPDGTPLGLLIEPPGEYGAQEQLVLDPLMLPENLVEAGQPWLRAATVFHAFQHSGAAEVAYRAWYTRQAVHLIDALLAQHGHHRSIGLIDGFRVNLGGHVRYRERDWELTGMLQAATTAPWPLTGSEVRPLITGGASMPDDFA